MKATVISTASRSDIQANLNMKYIIFDVSNFVGTSPRFAIKAADYFNTHGYYPKSISIITYNGTITTFSGNGLTLVSTEEVGEDTIYKYNFDADYYITSRQTYNDYNPVYYITSFFVSTSTTKIMIEDVGITAMFLYSTRTSGSVIMDYNYYIHYPKREAIVTTPMVTDDYSADSSAGLFKDSMPVYVPLETRGFKITMSKEEFLEILSYCSYVNLSTFNFTNGEPTALEIINNIDINYPTAYDDDSTGVWIGFISSPYSKLSPEDVAQAFKNRGARNFYCLHGRSSSRKDLIYIDADGEISING